MRVLQGQQKDRNGISTTSLITRILRPEAVKEDALTSPALRVLGELVRPPSSLAQGIYRLANGRIYQRVLGLLLAARESSNTCQAETAMHVKWMGRVVASAPRNALTTSELPVAASQWGLRI
jgi:hypothetical protein